MWMIDLVSVGLGSNRLLNEPPYELHTSVRSYQDNCVPVSHAICFEVYLFAAFSEWNPMHVSCSSVSRSHHTLHTRCVYASLRP